MAELRASHGQPPAATAAPSASPVNTESQQASAQAPLAPAIQQTSAPAPSAGTPVTHNAPALAHAAPKPAQPTTAPTFRPATIAAPSVTLTPTNNGSTTTSATATTALAPKPTPGTNRYLLRVGDMDVHAMIDSGADASVVVPLPPPAGMNIQFSAPTLGVSYVAADNRPLNFREGSAIVTVGDHLVLPNTPVLCVEGVSEVLMGSDLINTVRDKLKASSYEVTNTGDVKFGNALTLHPVSAPQPDHQTAPFGIRRVQQDSVLQKTVEICNPLSAPTPRLLASVTRAFTNNSACHEDFRRATHPPAMAGGLNVDSSALLAVSYC